MSYMGGNRRARVNPDHPEAFAICDRCGFVRNRIDLRAQTEYRGGALVSSRLMVCYDTCFDIPHQFDKPLRLPRDPEPVKDPRPNQNASLMGAAPTYTTVQQLIED